MRLAVLSGKGGAGKTMVAVNLAAAAGEATYVDCDVEEPNGRLFLKPSQVQEEAVSTFLPRFSPEACDGCQKCVESCRFNALICIKNSPRVFSEVCHSCGLCALVCPQKAVTLEPRPVGHLELGLRGKTRVITGVLNPGESSGVPVIEAALRAAEAGPSLRIIDCPPGSACSVLTAASRADACILVAEPTAFGFHNFKMVYRLVTLLQKPCGVIINKLQSPYGPLEDFCRTEKLPVLARIPYDPRAAALCAAGEVLGEALPEMGALFRAIPRRLEKEGIL